MGKATLSFSTNAFMPEDLIPCLDWAAKLGVVGVEVGPRNAERLVNSESEFDAAVQSFQKSNLKPLSMHAWTQVEGLPEVCPFAEKLKAGLIVVHCRDEMITDDFNNQTGMLSEWGKWCRDRGIVLSVENSSKQKPDLLVTVFEAVPEISLTLDVKHAHKPETLDMTYKDYMAVLADRLGNFHISGIDRAREVLGDGCPPGNDAVDWQELAESLAALDYSGIITAELNLPRWLSEEEREPLYPDLPRATAEMPTVAHRLAKHAVDYFREQFAEVAD